MLKLLVVVLLSNTNPFNVGDIACIDYNAGAEQITLLYVGANDVNAATSASDWKNISSSADGVMSVSGDGTTIMSTGGQTPVISAIKGAIADNDGGLVDGDTVFDALQGTTIAATGDVTLAASAFAIGGANSYAISITPDAVDLAEINAAQAATATDDAGKMLTINSTGTGLVWADPNTTMGTVRKTSFYSC